ncbi:MAG TPA: ADP-ribosylation factor-like protein [Planctomycetota bacterium]|nr:ADP-ribosylation factor-like protein [Planctomycetota bacterium]
MVQINFAQKQVNAKVVYYGPGMSGKTTNLEIVHQRAPEQNKGDLTSISTDGDRTLFFDFMPLDLGTVAGMRTCFQIYTVPGQVYYNSTRKLVLQGVDGVVFVADSSAAMKEENFESLRNLEENLNEYGKSLATLPHVIQFNKRDLPDALPVEELNTLYNQHNAPFFEAVAKSGQGVFPTLKALAASVLESIHQNNGGQSRAAASSQARPATPAGRSPAAPLPRTAQEATPARQIATAAVGSVPATEQPGLALHASGAAAQRSMMTPPPMQPSAHAPAAYANPGAPAMNQAGILTQTGFHNAALGTPPQAAQPQTSLHMSGRSMAHAGANAPAAQRTAPRPEPPRTRTTPRPAVPAGGKTLEGTRFRPRSQSTPRPQPRATPAGTRKTKSFTWVLVGLAVAVLGVVAWVASSFF